MQVLDPVSVILKQKGGRTWSIHAGDTVYDAIALMADKQIGALLVMENSRLLGMLSERDYARKVILRGRFSKETRVDEIMTSDPATITPDCPIDDAMRMMTESRVRHLPVVDARGTVVGIVSIGDLVKWIITSHQETIEQLQSYIAGTF